MHATHCRRPPAAGWPAGQLAVSAIVALRETQSSEIRFSELAPLLEPPASEITRYHCCPVRWHSGSTGMSKPGQRRIFGSPPSVHLFFSPPVNGNVWQHQSIRGVHSATTLCARNTKQARRTSLALPPRFACEPHTHTSSLSIASTSTPPSLPAHHRHCSPRDVFACRQRPKPCRRRRVP